MRGDLIFYHGTGWEDSFIQWWTKSPFSHVAIDVGEGMMVEALNEGILKNPLNLSGGSVWSYSESVQDADPKDMDLAVKWLDEVVGMHLPYGWMDFVSNANPFKKLFYVASPQHYDCSALATGFLSRAGGVDLCGLDSDPHLVTPADLAKCLGMK